MATKMTLSMVSFCLLLALAHLLVAAPAPATPTTAATLLGAAAATVGGHDGDDPLLHLLPGGVAAAGCWKAVLQAESCAGDILRAMLAPLDAGAGRIGAACCGVLQAVGDRCIDAVFAESPLSPLYAAHVKHACGFPVGPAAGRHR